MEVELLPRLPEKNHHVVPVMHASDLLELKTRLGGVEIPDEVVKYDPYVLHP